jgi:hypothetical protein
MPRLTSLLAIVLFFVWNAQADTVELKSGERLEGKFREAGASGVVIEATGQPIKLALESVRAISISDRLAQPLPPALGLGRRR